MDVESHLPKPKRDELKLSSKGMVKRTICKNNPNKVWVILGYVFALYVFNIWG
jgi:hypothetical protein